MEVGQVRCLGEGRTDHHTHGAEPCGPVRGGSAVASSALVHHGLRDGAPVVQPRALELGTSGLEVAASTNTPRPVPAARSSAGASEPKPRYGETVTASEHSGEPSDSQVRA